MKKKLRMKLALENGQEVSLERRYNPDGSIGGWVSPHAKIHPSAYVNKGAMVGPGVVLNKNSHVGEGSLLLS